MESGLSTDLRLIDEIDKSGVLTIAGKHRLSHYISKIRTCKLRDPKTIVWVMMHPTISQGHIPNRDFPKLMLRFLRASSVERFVPIWEAPKITWWDVVSKQRSLPKESVERLLIGMYTLIPPCKLELFDIPIVWKGSNGSKPNGNYLRLSRENTKYGCLHLHQEIVLPEALVGIIHLNIKHHPREHLFVRKNNDPFESQNSYGKWAARCLASAFGMPFTVNTFRKLYKQRFESMTIRDKMIRSAASL